MQTLCSLYYWQKYGKASLGEPLRLKVVRRTDTSDVALQMIEDVEMEFGSAGRRPQCQCTRFTLGRHRQCFLKISLDLCHVSFFGLRNDAAQAI